MFTVRTASFDAASEGSSEVSVEDGKGTAGELQSEWVSEELTVSDRPDLGSATKVVSGGRGLKNKENFDTIMEPLADALGAAIGASRAAVDSGYADNSLQVRAASTSSNSPCGVLNISSMFSVSRSDRRARCVSPRLPSGMEPSKRRAITNMPRFVYHAQIVSPDLYLAVGGRSARLRVGQLIRLSS